MGDQPLPRQVLTPSAFLFDLDGTLYTEHGSIPGAVDAIARLRRRGFVLRFVTNTTRHSRAQILDRLRHYGFELADDELFTPTAAAGAIFARRGVRVVAPFLPALVLGDLDGVELVGGTSGVVAERAPEAVVIGDLGDRWSPSLLNEAFRYVLDGAELVALQKGKYWAGPTGLELDAGAYVAAIEFATDRAATVCGKPERPFFHAVVGSVGLEPPFDHPTSKPVMIGDDLWNDVAGAQRAGLAGWLVKTGKFRDEVLERTDVQPDRVIDSVARLIEEFG